MPAFLRIACFGFIFFLIVALPFSILEKRYFMRYSYFGHGGIAISLVALLQGAASRMVRRWERKQDAESSDPASGISSA